VANLARQRRVADQIQRELAEIIRGELKDPRVGMITLTGVEVSPDLAHAKVFFTTLAGEPQREETLAGLKRAAGFLRSELGHRIKIHSTPELHFFYDASVERGMRLSQLIDDAVAGAKPAE
jgi:ribosome-binding factor A